jgi:hypothetical protein
VTKLGQIDFRSITRETADRWSTYRDPLMVKLDANGRFLELWQKKKRCHLPVTYAEVFQYALMRDAHAAVRERKREREERRKQRLKR